MIKHWKRKKKNPSHILISPTYSLYWVNMYVDLLLSRLFLSRFWISRGFPIFINTFCLLIRQQQQKKNEKIILMKFGIAWLLAFSYWLTTKMVRNKNNVVYKMINRQMTAQNTCIILKRRKELKKKNRQIGVTLHTYVHLYYRLLFNTIVFSWRFFFLLSFVFSSFFLAMNHRSYSCFLIEKRRRTTVCDDNVCCPKKITIYTYT